MSSTRRRVSVWRNERFVMTAKHVHADTRVDPYLGTVVHVVGTRQARPNRPSSGCPFCPGGLESPDPYDVRWFRNRWPAMPGDRCEVVLYTSEHDASFASLGQAGARKVVDLWAERTAALARRADVDFVLVFENRGNEVGATIAHPHGQIYAYDHVPSRPGRLLRAGWQPELGPSSRQIIDCGGWVATVPAASTFPIAVSIAPRRQVPDLVSLTPADRDQLAAMLVDVFGRLDRLYERPLPYMMWINQCPTDGGSWPSAWCNIEIVSPWRAAGTSRFIAAAEVAGDEYFNPVIPEDLAERLRSLAIEPELRPAG
jgi:UDPglucose--hexose-1-phosphate uridylyltransferase